VALRVVVLGAGFGGLELTTLLSEAFGTGIDCLQEPCLGLKASTALTLSIQATSLKASAKSSGLNRPGKPPAGSGTTYPAGPAAITSSGLTGMTISA